MTERRKTSALLLRLSPAHKEALRQAAEEDGLSMAGLVEYWIEQFCQTPELKKALRVKHGE